MVIQSIMMIDPTMYPWAHASRTSACGSVGLVTLTLGLVRSWAAVVVLMGDMTATDACMSLRPLLYSITETALNMFRSNRQTWGVQATMFVSMPKWNNSRTADRASRMFIYVSHFVASTPPSKVCGFANTMTTSIPPFWQLLFCDLLWFAVKELPREN